MQELFPRNELFLQSNLRSNGKTVTINYASDTKRLVPKTVSVAALRPLDDVYLGIEHVSTYPVREGLITIFLQLWKYSSANVFPHSASIRMRKLDGGRNVLNDRS